MLDSIASSRNDDSQHNHLGFKSAGSKEVWSPHRDHRAI